MTPCQATILADRSVVRIGGADARKFLQGLITNDMERVRDGNGLFAGLLTPQGKILFEFFISEAEGAFLLDCAAAAVGDLVKRLGFYRLRASVEITDISDTHRVIAVWNGAPSPDAVVSVYPDPRLPELGFRLIVARGLEAASVGRLPADMAAYHALRLRLGAPEAGEDFPLGELFPHEANYDQLDGVDFRKGCFIGQEVVSRMEHRGTARARIVPVTSETTLPARGTSIVAGTLPIGALGSTSQNAGLAYVRLDRAAQAIETGTPITADGTALTLLQPNWARFTVPRAAA